VIISLFGVINTLVLAVLRANRRGGRVRRRSAGREVRWQ
jgi:hypothetical protein